MGKTNNMRGTEAAQKIKELAEKERICMFATMLTEIPLSVRPMSAAAVDPDGSLWFFSNKNSHLNEDLEKDGRVHLFFSNTSSSEYLSLYGHAEIVNDRDKIEELWSPWLKTWFHEGKDDPTLCMLHVFPHGGYYWDTQHNKIVQMAKMTFGAITGKETDDSLEGKLSK